MQSSCCKMLKWQLRLAAIFIGVSITLMVISGCTKKEDSVRKASDAAADTFAIREGERLYSKYCMPCHGSEGQGDGLYFTTNIQPTPPDFTDNQFMSSRTDKQLFDAIIESPAGAENKGVCPPWGDTFVEEEIDLLITYIRNRFTEVPQ